MSRPKAWVCAPGVRRIPNLAAFLPDHELVPAPRADVAAVIGWGLKPSGALGRRWATKRGLPFTALEDGFLRSVGLGETGATSLGIVVDDLGVYYDATRPSRLEDLIRTAPDWCDAALAGRARALLDRLVETGLSKTNLGAPVDPALIEDRPRVLVVDQTWGDASIRHGLATEQTFAEMLAGVRAAHPDAQILVKRHPAVAAGKKRGCIPAEALTGVTLIDTDVAPASLLSEVQAVHVVTSGLGFEALWRGLPVTCWGAPFYAGWGLTQDRVTVERRGQPRTIEQLAAAALIRYARYVDPVTGRAIEVEQAVERLVVLRDRARRLSGLHACVGFAPAKRPPVRRLLNSPLGQVRYFGSTVAARSAAEVENGRVVAWASRAGEGVADIMAGSSAPLIRMEDGFIRSRGLGSDFFGALSVALDDQGVYYDPSAPSRLETLLATHPFPDDIKARARRLRERIVSAGLSKYNLPPAETGPAWSADRRRILIVGQVENDQSILKGCADIRTNSTLVQAVRAEHPDAFLIFKTHPDVVAGNRPGRLDDSARALVDAQADDLDIVQALDASDALATLTSLSGFEALLRGKPVMTWGRPFYAGWGLTEDRLDFPRRGRTLELDSLVAAALLLYPVYVAPNGFPCEAEDLVEALIAARDAPPPAAPRGQVQRWWKGVRASLDRTPPPAY
ncbi:capsular polysaccharide biosynthesis protein [Brevundimonas lutea]|uniref:capsular polysaccharide biosynthesis protein n=1 Tax=Brevundimonas lutea TaxID=2293980 RepID=UPI00196A8300|nr:capsular polysaccharide biosynthesis protein [Brevundimonas lutea]